MYVCMCPDVHADASACKQHVFWGKSAGVSPSCVACVLVEASRKPSLSSTKVEVNCIRSSPQYFQCLPIMTMLMLLLFFLWGFLSGLYDVDDDADDGDDD